MTVTGSVKKIEEYENKIILEEGVVILIDEISAVEGELFHELYE